MSRSVGREVKVQESSARPLVMVTGGVAIAIVLAALFTGVREVAYGALSALVLAGFWPIILIVGLWALVVVIFTVPIVIFVALSGASLLDSPPDLDVGTLGVNVPDSSPNLDPGDPKDGWKLIRWYYRWLSQLRHPVVLGTGAGLVVGTAAVWLMLVVLVIPKERATLSTLLSVQQGIERHYREQRRYPAAGPNGEVPSELVTSGSSLTDGFGRAVSYRVTGAGMLSAYTLSSLGADGRPSDDDLCVEGAARPARWLRSAAEVFQVFVIGEASTKLSETVGALESARCGRDGR